MRNRRVRAEHQEAVSRRLAQLSEELSAARAASPHPSSAPGPSGSGSSASRAPEVDSDYDVDPGSGHGAVEPTVATWWAMPHAQALEVEPARRPDDVPRYDPRAVAQELLVTPEPWLARSPGRHVSRRPGSRPAPAPSRVADLLPETLRGRVRLGSGALAVVAVLVACAVMLTAWRVVRADPAPPTLPVAAPASGDLVEGPDDDAGAGSTSRAGVADVPAPAETDPGAPPATDPVVTDVAADGTVTVDVAGKVRRPGIVVLPAGARVVDALEQAGGPRAGVDTTSLNLARPLVDGEQLLVGVEAPSVAPVVPGAASSGVPGATTALVDLNLATQPELEELPEVGPVTATAIIAWREQNGGFTAVSELLEVDGIGDATLAQLTPLVTV